MSSSMPPPPPPALGNSANTSDEPRYTGQLDPSDVISLFAKETLIDSIRKHLIKLESSVLLSGVEVQAVYKDVTCQPPPQTFRNKFFETYIVDCQGTTTRGSPTEHYYYSLHVMRPDVKECHIPAVERMVLNERGVFDYAQKHVSGVDPVMLMAEFIASGGPVGCTTSESAQRLKGPWIAWHRAEALWESGRVRDKGVRFCSKDATEYLKRIARFQAELVRTSQKHLASATGSFGGFIQGFTHTDKEGWAGAELPSCHRFEIDYRLQVAADDPWRFKSSLDWFRKRLEFFEFRFKEMEKDGQWKAESRSRILKCLRSSTRELAAVLSSMETTWRILPSFRFYSTTASTCQAFIQALPVWKLLQPPAFAGYNFPLSKKIDKRHSKILRTGLWDVYAQILAHELSPSNDMSEWGFEWWIKSDFD
ncbi:hypothetical protein BJ508DRAFT_311866 [Ascobolus immersus RN42]|uniref:Uncharacterized protein n=1 Tax=Ascobolus immersus RN42 TaxID=1160509 RepID=A0A3N4HRG0_ASCIM|nr:hypothetical protein BJ508DRAFT_311866 [Ascobolus immersus RN42]